MSGRIEDIMSKPTERPQTIDLKALFLGLQKEMLAALAVDKQHLPHPGTKGDATELQWITLLEHYLPKRYAVAKAFVLDSTGTLSDQLDVVIYDRFYTPFLLNHNNAQYIPAEGVYGVFEVKQTLDKAHLEYAAAKADSVRRLKRTSAAITHAGGTFEPRPPIPILAGLLCTDGTWQTPAANLASLLANLPETARIDLFCALRSGTYESKFTEQGVTISASSADAALVTFMLCLLARLQRVGTVPAMDYSAYAGAL
jgi:hypothetical protein